MIDSRHGNGTREVRENSHGFADGADGPHAGTASAGRRPPRQSHAPGGRDIRGADLDRFLRRAIHTGQRRPLGGDPDLAHQYVPWRDFGFSELLRGHFALWNPYLYCGTPYFGGFQSGLLYPPNCAYLILPLAKAINFGIALHIFLAGFFMYLWASRRRLHFLACLLCGALWMFCGEHYLHITAGHLCRLIATAWIPIVFLAIDGLFEDRSPRWALLGIFGISMMILGGDPQYVFYTAVAAAIYCALCLVRAERRTRIALGLVLMVAGAAAITAVQLWTGMEATGSSVRGSGGVPYEFARVFSFPPRNFLTLLAPGFFGDVTHLNTGASATCGRCACS